MNRIKIGALIVALLISAGPADMTQARSKDIYVSTTGDDSNDGGSPATAFATLRHALRRAGPGTVIRVLPGTYRESARARVRGLLGAPITVIGTGGRPVFSGGGVDRYGLWLDGSRHVILERLAFRDYTDIGVVIVESSNMTLRKLRVHGNGFDPQIGWVEGYGIHLDESSDLLVERNRVFDNGPNPRPWNSAGTGINGFAMERAVIRKNRSYDNHGGGILVEDSFDVLVKRNRITGNDLDVWADGWWDGGIWVDGGADVRLIRNTITDNLGPGIEISDEDCQSPTGYLLRGNVSTRNYYGIFIWNFGTTGFPPEDILKVSGNRFENNSRKDVWIDADIEDCRS